MAQRIREGTAAAISVPSLLLFAVISGEGGEGGRGELPGEFIDHSKEFRELTEETELLLFRSFDGRFAVMKKELG
jgi:hypothetical protein